MTMVKRDQERAVRQIVAAVHKHLGDCAPEKVPPGCRRKVLTEANVLNLARHIVMGLDIYGREEARQ
jgi:hypothetical protein